MKRRSTIILTVVIVLLSFIMASCSAQKKAADQDKTVESQGDQTGITDTEGHGTPPWENGGKQPLEYTWEEFEALPPEQQIAFQNSFVGSEEFEAWMQNAQSGSIDKPWENGGKQPKDYTWEEFEALPPAQQIAFQNSFANFEAFDSWLRQAQYREVDKPWENGGKQPQEYTWEEFEALSPDRQMAFQNAFESADAFEAWMQEAQFDSIDKPWENGGKQPKDYTWEEFTALEPGQQMEFQYSFGSIEEFDKWLTANEPKS